MIRQVTDDKLKYFPLLLIGDEQESMIEEYLDRGDLFVFELEGAVRGVCVVTSEGPGRYELKNIAVEPGFQRKGLGRAMVEFVWKHYPDREILELGTGDSPSTVGFYTALGFREFRREKDYFLKYYDHPIYEDGKRLRDQIRFRKTTAL